MNTDDKNYLFHTSKQLVLYLIFGIATTIINMICYGILYDTMNIENTISTILAWLAAVIFAFITNKLFVFESRRKEKTILLKEVASFFGARLATGILDVIIMVIAVECLKWNGLLCKLISNIVVTVINYVASKFVVFEKTQGK